MVCIYVILLNGFTQTVAPLGCCSTHFRPIYGTSRTNQNSSTATVRSVCSGPGTLRRVVPGEKQLSSCTASSSSSAKSCSPIRKKSLAVERAANGSICRTFKRCLSSPSKITCGGDAEQIGRFVAVDGNRIAETLKIPRAI